MRRIRAHKLRQHLIKLQPQPIEPRAQNSIRRLRFVVSIGPRIDERSDRFEPGGITDRNFEKLSRRPAFDAEDANPIAALVFQPNGREIRDAIRRDVLVRIAHLINQLFLDRRNDDPAAGAFMFCDHECAVRRRFDDRKSDVRQIGNAAPLVLAISAGALRAAFDDVTGDRAGRQICSNRLQPSQTRASAAPASGLYPWRGR